MKNGSRPAVRVLLVDSHPIISLGIHKLLSQQAGFRICGDVSTEKEALDIIPIQKPDLVIMGLDLNGTVSLSLIRAIKLRYPAIMILVFSRLQESLYAERVLRSGAHGYLMKTEPPEKIMSVIRQVLSGRVYVSQQVTDQIIQKNL